MRKNQIIRSTFSIFDAAGVKVTGRYLNVTKTLQKNNAASAEVVTVAESSATSGDYQASFTPLDGGVGVIYRLDIFDATYNTQGWTKTWEVLNDDAESINTDVDAVLADTAEMQPKLPTNNFMGSSDKDNHDTDIDSILTDSNEIQGKLPTNYIMGSAVTSAKDDEIDSILTDTADIQPNVASILTDTNEIQGKLPTNYIMGSTVITAKDDEIDSILTDTSAIVWTDVTDIKSKTTNLPTDPADQSLVETAITNSKNAIISELSDMATTGNTQAIESKVDIVDTNVDSILADTNEIQGKLPTNYIMGSAVQTAKDDEIDAIKDQTAVIVWSDITDIKDQTDLIPTDPADQSLVESAITTAEDNIVAKINELPTTGNTQAIESKVDILDTNVDSILADTGDIKTQLIPIRSELTTIYQIETGKWLVVNNQLILYQDDNVTEICRFNLFNEAGAPAMIDIYKKTRV